MEALPIWARSSVIRKVIKMMFEQLPKDPMLLLSVVNTKLRDYYESLDVLCQDMNVDKEELVSRLLCIDYEYDECRNQFV